MGLRGAVGRKALVFQACLIPAISGYSAVQAQEQRLEFNIPRSDLGAVLSKIASVAGKPVAFPANLTAGQVAGPIVGRKSLRAAFGEALAGSGLSLASAGGGFTVVARAARMAASDAAGLAGDIADIDVPGGGSHGDDGFLAGDTGPTTRIDAPIKEIPLSVTAVTNDVIRSENLTNVVDATQNVAGVSIQPTGFGVPNFNIRVVRIERPRSGRARDGATIVTLSAATGRHIEPDIPDELPPSIARAAGPVLPPSRGSVDDRVVVDGRANRSTDRTPGLRGLEADLQGAPPRTQWSRQ